MVLKKLNRFQIESVFINPITNRNLLQEYHSVCHFQCPRIYNMVHEPAYRKACNNFTCIKMIRLCSLVEEF